MSYVWGSDDSYLTILGFLIVPTLGRALVSGSHDLNIVVVYILDQSMAGTTVSVSLSLTHKAHPTAWTPAHLLYKPLTTAPSLQVFTRLLFTRVCYILLWFNRAVVWSCLSIFA
jgi:hypothetical protein